MNYSELELKTVDQLRVLARESGLADVGVLRKAALITRILHGAGEAGAGVAQIEPRPVAPVNVAPVAATPVAPDASGSVQPAPRARGAAVRRVTGSRAAPGGAEATGEAQGDRTVTVDPVAPEVAPTIAVHVAQEPALAVAQATAPSGRRAPNSTRASDGAATTPNEDRAVSADTRAQDTRAGAPARDPLVPGRAEAMGDRGIAIQSVAPSLEPAAIPRTTEAAPAPLADVAPEGWTRSFNSFDGEASTSEDRRSIEDRGETVGVRPAGAPFAPGTPAVRPFERHRGRDRGRGGERPERPVGPTGERHHGGPAPAGGFAFQAPPAPVRQGVLEIMDDGYGFLRLDRHWMPGTDDIYVAQAQIRRFGLRTGDVIVGQMRLPKDSEKYASLLRIDSVNGLDPETAKRRPVFDNLTALFPNRMFDLEMSGIQGARELQQANLSNRVINLLSPIGRGQRGLIVSPPKAGKTMLLKGIAHAITRNQPDAHVMVALIGERPEEVTDWQKTVPGAEVISSTFDEPAESHTRVAEMCLERAKRVAEIGRDVIILLDSITRLARAYNQCVPPSGRTLSGGMDPAALFPPKRFFGAARNLEEGGSLTIVATCLVETESRLDDLIYEEFKGTGNMELRLDRKLQEKRIFPAINVSASSTRRDDLLLGETVLRHSVMLRRIIASVGTTEAVERMIETMSKTETNREFLQAMAKVSA